MSVIADSIELPMVLLEEMLLVTQHLISMEKAQVQFPALEIFRIVGLIMQPSTYNSSRVVKKSTLLQNSLLN